MAHKGFSHIGLSTRDLNKTRDFYEHTLGFKPVRCDIVKIKEGGRLNRARHEESHDGDFWSTFELASRLRGCWTCPNGCLPLLTR